MEMRVSVFHLHHVVMSFVGKIQRFLEPESNILTIERLYRTVVNFRKEIKSELDFFLTPIISHLPLQFQFFFISFFHIRFFGAYTLNVTLLTFNISKYC